MNDELKIFIENNIDLIDNNNWTTVYEKAQRLLTSRDIEELINTFISVGIDDINIRENMVIDSFKYYLALTLTGEEEGYSMDIESWIKNNILHVDTNTLWGFKLQDLIHIFVKNKSIWSNRFNVILGTDSLGNLTFKYCG